MGIFQHILKVGIITVSTYTENALYTSVDEPPVQLSRVDFWNSILFIKLLILSFVKLSWLILHWFEFLRSLW